MLVTILREKCDILKKVFEMDFSIYYFKKKHLFERTAITYNKPFAWCIDQLLWLITMLKFPHFLIHAFMKPTTL